MKQDLFKKLCQPPQLSQKDIFLVLIPIALWVIASLARPHLIGTKCSDNPSPCTPSSVFVLDRLSLGFEDGKADQYSYLTQNLSGVLALSLPPLWQGSRLLLKRISPLTAAFELGTDLILVTETISWNGFFTELSHHLVQRPRPFVYSNPLERGTDPAHYTSFYSGHTSFAAAANTALVLILLGRSAPWLLVFLTTLSGQVLIFMTAYFRILAGRHFLTDVLMGAFAGTLIALAIAFLHKTKNSKVQKNQKK